MLQYSWFFLLSPKLLNLLTEVRLNRFSFYIGLLVYGGSGVTWFSSINSASDTNFYCLDSAKSFSWSIAEIQFTVWLLHYLLAVYIFMTFAVQSIRHLSGTSRHGTSCLLLQSLAFLRTCQQVLCSTCLLEDSYCLFPSLWFLQPKKYELNGALYTGLARKMFQLLGSSSGHCLLVLFHAN